MLSGFVRDSVEALAPSIVADRFAEFKVAHSRMIHEHASRGMFASSITVRRAYGLMNDSIRDAAVELMTTLLDANQADPISDIRGRATDLAGLLRQFLDELHVQCLAIVEPLVQKIGVQNFDSSKLDEHARILSRNSAALGLELMRRAAVAASLPSSDQTINVHGPVGALQTGAGATAHVNQTVEYANRADLVAAVDQILSELRAGPTATAIETVEAIEVFADIRTEICKEVPNKSRLAGLLTGIATTIQTIPNLAPAWQTLCNWATKLGL